MAKFFSSGKEADTKTETENRDFYDLCEKVNSRNTNVKSFLETAYWSENSAWFSSPNEIKNGTKLINDLNDIFYEIINFIKKHHENEIISRNLVILKDKIQLDIISVTDRKKLVEKTHVERMIKKKEQEQKKEELEQERQRQRNEKKGSEEWEENILKNNFTEKIKRFFEVINNNPFIKKHGITISSYREEQKNNVFIVKMEYQCQTKPRGGMYYFRWYPSFDPVSKEIRSVHSYACGTENGYYPGSIISLDPLENIIPSEIHQCILKHPLVEKIHCE